VDPEADEGLIDIGGSKAVAIFIQSCRKLRLWSREMAVKL
jgi:catalase